MSKAQKDFSEPKNLKLLRILVTVLTITMIVGIITLVFLIVIKVQSLNNFVSIDIPKEIILPKNTIIRSFTAGTNWHAIVTESDEILIYDSLTNKLLRAIQIK